jgi:23S rRNA (adenine2503-C2)-methyltransferase
MSLTPEALTERLLALGEKKYRAEQVFLWLREGISSFDAMTNISEALREKLAAEFALTVPELAKSQRSADGTAKYLWRFSDGQAVETVVMSYHHGLTVCVSTQAGCRMGCAFCASAAGGLIRNLSAAEILAQVLYSQREYGGRISNIVLMGTGEPLDNFESVLAFVRIVTHPKSLNIGMRHITISTSGLVPQMDRLGDCGLQLCLAVSLHSADDETRSRLMPVNSAYGVDEVVAAAKRYFAKTNRRVAYEYAMIDGVNDSPEQARLLAKKLRGQNCFVNIISLNRVENSHLAPPSDAHVREFAGILDKAGVQVTFRRKLGDGIDAACGQLRAASIKG